MLLKLRKNYRKRVDNLSLAMFVRFYSNTVLQVHILSLQLKLYNSYLSV